MNKPKLAYTVREAAEACGVSEQTIRRATRCGDLPVTYPTARPVILADDLESWLRSKPTERAS